MLESNTTSNDNIDIRWVHQKRHEFIRHNGKYPNILFIEKKHIQKIMESIYNSFRYIEDEVAFVHNHSDKLMILGMKTVFSDGYNGVDFLEELEPKKEKEKPQTKLIKKEGKRKIIL